MEKMTYYKKNKGDTVWWVRVHDTDGMFLVSFDGENTLNLFADYPQNFTKEQKEIFDKENPFWADFLKDYCE